MEGRKGICLKLFYLHLASSPLKLVIHPALNWREIFDMESVVSVVLTL